MNVRQPGSARVVSLVLMPIFLAGCTMQWKPTTLSPQNVVRYARPDSLRVTLTDGSRLIATQPAIVGDSLFYGARTSDPTEGRRNDRPAIPLSEIATLETIKVGGVGVTLGYVGFALVAVGFVAFAAFYVALSASPPFQ